jgi:hypothetical protein
MQTWSDKEDLGNGIICYRDVIKKDFDVVNRLESVLGSVAGYGELSPEGKRYHWMPAYVGYQQLMPDYRDCVDFKYKKTDIENDKSEDSIKLQELWQDVYNAQSAAVEDYRRIYNIMPLKYWEAFNFIKYGPGQHFMEHHDHGYSYNCTLSLVAYVNDDYDGGDLYVFPSNFMYPHQAMPVHSGTKYSIVTMLDYSKKYHTPDMYDPKWDNE